jgi:hypothetical protein
MPGDSFESQEVHQVQGYSSLSTHLLVSPSFLHQLEEEGEIEIDANIEKES